MKAITLKSRQSNRYLSAADRARVGELTKTVAPPFMILRTSVVAANLARLCAAIPRAEVFYAVKANNYPAILETLHRDGCSFDISSHRELATLAAMGVRPEATIHSNPVKSIVEFDAAVEAGARVFVADNISELDKFAKYGDRTEVLLRFKTGYGGSVVNLSYKFGADPADIPPMLDRILELGLSFKGFCFHVGSQCTAIDKYTHCIDTARELIALAAGKGLATEILDIGGGFPISYTDDVPAIETIGAEISAALTAQIAPDIRVVCEPGRFICGDAITLFSSVIGKTVRDGVTWYYIDDGLYGSFSGRLYDQCSYQILTNRNTTWEKAVLAGPTCDSFDVIYKDCLLPPLTVGDLLIFPAMGAYCSVSASDFNGLKLTKVVVVDW
ncbi:MAG: type III PLP-dependent enzyme [candidate division Zixibacteria bacterium]|nr:type III PLP-dependent enzyme [candidate division Zixibacteria bacterium]